MKLTIHKDDGFFTDSKRKDIAAYEAEIGAIVARLYGLTEAELQIIRGEP